MGGGGGGTHFFTSPLVFKKRTRQSNNYVDFFYEFYWFSQAGRLTKDGEHTQNQSRLTHYENTPMQYTEICQLKLSLAKMIFLIFLLQTLIFGTR